MYAALHIGSVSIFAVVSTDAQVTVPAWAHTQTLPLDTFLTYVTDTRPLAVALQAVLTPVGCVAQANC